MNMKFAAYLSLLFFFTGCKDEGLETRYKQLESECKQLESDYKQLESEHKQLAIEHNYLEISKKEQEYTLNNIKIKLDQIEQDEQKRQNRLTPLQRQNLSKVLESGAKINAAVKSGIDHNSFKILYADFNGDVALALQNWPQAMPLECKKAITESSKAWEIGLWLSQSRVENVTRTGSYGKIAIPLELKDSFGGKNEFDNYVMSYVEFGTYIKMGLNAGSSRFENAQKMLIEELNK
jgi:hypothetical protein